MALYVYHIYIYTKNTGEKMSVHMMQVQIDDISLMEALNNHVAAEEAVTARVVDVKEEVEPGDDKELPLSRPIPSPARSRAQGSKPASSLKGARPRTRQEPCKPNQSSYKPVYIACMHATILLYSKQTAPTVRSCFIWRPKPGLPECERIRKKEKIWRCHLGLRS